MRMPKGTGWAVCPVGYWSYLQPHGRGELDKWPWTRSWVFNEWGWVNRSLLKHSNEEKGQVGSHVSLGVTDLIPSVQVVTVWHNSWPTAWPGNVCRLLDSGAKRRPISYYSYMAAPARNSFLSPSFTHYNQVKPAEITNASQLEGSEKSRQAELKEGHSMQREGHVQSPWNVSGMGSLRRPVWLKQWMRKREERPRWREAVGLIMENFGSSYKGTGFYPKSGNYWKIWAEECPNLTSLLTASLYWD